VLAQSAGKAIASCAMDPELCGNLYWI